MFENMRTLFQTAVQFPQFVLQMQFYQKSTEII